MSRIRSLAGLTAVAALAMPAVALAMPASALAASSKGSQSSKGAQYSKRSNVTGGSTQIAISPATSNALSANHLTVAPLAPATASGATFSFPIVGGHLQIKSKHGVIRHRGGFTISNGVRTVGLRHPTLVSNENGVSLFALVRVPAMAKCRHHPGRRHCFAVRSRRVARVTGATLQGGSATGTVRLTEFSANAINKLAGKRIATAGTAIGTVTITPTFG
ncbi:MAG TPA: hypothetical protein VGL51_12070 [Solirubrobacteraceae bacterium]|jgi:hypothetical protein